MKSIVCVIMLACMSLMHAADSDVDQKLKTKIGRVLPQSPKHLIRLLSAQDLAQAELVQAKSEKRDPSALAQQVAAITTSHTAKMWEQVAQIQEQVKTK